MKKLGRRLLILIILGGVLYGGYYVFLRPTGFTSKTELAQEYFEQFQQPDVCERYFNPETMTYCTSFAAQFEGESITVDSVTESGQTVDVTVSINGNSATFTVNFISESVPGLRGVLNGTYYLIDTIG